MKRRTFLQATAAAAPVTALSACDRGWNVTALRSLCDTLLPTELGTESRVRIADEFAAWAGGIREGVELNHGYGTGELSFTGESPWPRWQQQLDELDQAAESRYGTGWASLDDEQRRELVRDALSHEESERLPDPRTAEHVVVAILAYFYASPEATDLAYRAAIRKQQCRPLDQSPRRPVTLESDA